jgi:hypothetical protein
MNVIDVIQNIQEKIHYQDIKNLALFNLKIKSLLI